MDLALKSTRWENVRKRIRTAIEEEKKRKAAILIKSVDDGSVGGAGEVEEPSENILVAVSAGDSGITDRGGAR